MGPAAEKLMPPRSPWVWLCTPIWASNLRMVATSCNRGTLTSVTGSGVNSVAQSSGKAAFFAPEMVTVPKS